MKEEFKTFVRSKPELVKFVNSGQMTWQKFYEQWRLYGEDEKVWNEYSKKSILSTKEEPFSFSSLTDLIKKVDMESVQKGVTSLQKVVELLQSFTTGNELNKTNSYKPRQLFKKFED